MSSICNYNLKVNISWCDKNTEILQKEIDDTAVKFAEEKLVFILRVRNTFTCESIHHQMISK
jgi:hypothetical protein